MKCIIIKGAKVVIESNMQNCTSIILKIIINCIYWNICPIFWNFIWSFMKLKCYEFELISLCWKNIKLYICKTFVEQCPKQCEDFFWLLKPSPNNLLYVLIYYIRSSMLNLQNDNKII